MGNCSFKHDDDELAVSNMLPVGKSPPIDLFRDPK
jgi:hypothetical protein